VFNAADNAREVTWTTSGANPDEDRDDVVDVKVTRRVHSEHHVPAGTYVAP